MIGKVCFVVSDLFGIADRLREIDRDYFVVYRYKKKRYEVHHRGQKGDSLAFVVPYDALDARTLNYARQTSRERVKQFLAEINADNLARELTQKSKMAKQAEFGFERALENTTRW